MSGSGVYGGQLRVPVGQEGSEVVIDGAGPEAWREPEAELDCGNSGSTLRMLAGALAGRPFRSVLTGDESLVRRPVERVAVPLRAMGTKVLTTDGKPPLTIEGGRLKGIAYDLPVASAQVKTAVLPDPRAERPAAGEGGGAVRGRGVVADARATGGHGAEDRGAVRDGLVAGEREAAAQEGCALDPHGSAGW